MLAIISELYYIMTGGDSGLDYGRYYDISREKARRMLEAGCVQRFPGHAAEPPSKAQDRGFKDPKGFLESGFHLGRFIGTSNAYSPMKIDLVRSGQWHMN